jgi:hypothetical protein
MKRTCLRQIAVLLVSLLAISTVSPGANPFAKLFKRHKQAASAPASRPHGKELGQMPMPIAQTIERQNSPSDKLRIDLTASKADGGQYVAYVRVAWGDLDNLITTGGKQYYSDWDGKVSLDNGATGEVARKIAFDDGSGAASRPAARAGKAGKAGKQAASAESGRDQMIQSQGATISWKAGVVGGMDGLLIRLTGKSDTITGTIQAGKFSVPFTVKASPAGAS